MAIAKQSSIGMLARRPRLVQTGQRALWTLVPIGAFPAEIAVACLPTRKRLFAFSGRIGHRPLSAGADHAVLSASDATGRSKPVTLSFVIAPS